VADRRAGRLDSDTGRRLCERLGDIDVEGVEVFVEPVKEYRLLLVLRGDGLSPRVSDTDPQRTGAPPRPPEAAVDEAVRTAEVVAEVLDQARELLADEDAADMILLRGFSRRPTWPTLPDIYAVSAAAVATYPMYRGVASLVGMEVLETGSTLADEIDTVASGWNDHDFVFVHFKPTDSAGEDGDGARKVELIEALDAELPRLLALSPDVVVVTGDHSTPCRLKSHSWHPVPVVLWASTCRPDRVETFGERSCVAGGLGPRLPATELMPLAFAHAERLRKFGA
jgi:2,3-bisphosphoglycerate-independent phosphoglycerate mutase